MANNNKAGWVDSADVFSNTHSRFLKHLFLPSIFGFIGGTLSLYIFSSYFKWWVNSAIAELQGEKYIIVKNKEILTDTASQFFYEKVLDNLITSVEIFAAGFIFLSVLTLILKIVIAKKHSAKYLEEQHLKGTNILTEEQLTKIQTKEKVKGITIGNTAKLDEVLELAHTFIVGAAGTGKTVLLNQVYYEERKKWKNMKAIVHDVKGDWTEKFYNPETDYIFNFNDKRSINFNIFSMIKIIPDIDSIVGTIIPMNEAEKDPVWVNTAQGLLRACILHCIKHDTKTNEAVKRLIIMSKEQLAKELENVEGAEVAYGYLTAGDTQGDNFMSNFRSKAQFFTSLPENMDGEEIDFEEWINSEGQSTIFLINDIKYKDLNAIRIAVFIDSFVKTVSTMGEAKGEDKDRRVYVFLDEMGSLSKMDAIVNGLALLRSFGVPFFIGIQEVQRLYSIYGKELTSTVVGNATSKIILRAQDVETQKFCSELIGERKFKSSNITNSTGSEINANREGASFANTEKTEKAVLASEIGNMKNNTYYYKNGNYNWTFIEKKFTSHDNFPKFNKGFIQREDMSIDNLFKGKKSGEDKKPEEITEEEVKQVDEAVKNADKSEEWEDII